MQTKLLNYTQQDSMYLSKKRVFEVFVSLFMLLVSFVVMFFFLVRKVLFKKDVFVSKTFFLNSMCTIEIGFFNCNNIFIKNLPAYLSILKSDISLVGVALVKYNRNIEYRVEHKPGLFSLWFVRKNSKMSNCTISSTNAEYMASRTIMNDVKIIFKNIITLLYFSKNKTLTKKVKIFDVLFDNLKLNEVMDFVKNSIENNLKKTIFFINADCLNKTFNDEEYKHILKKSDLLLPDGSGVNMACNILDKPLCENVNGTDMLPHICELAQENGYRIYLLGAKNGVAYKMKEELRKKYPNIIIVGVDNGYFRNQREEIEAIKKINRTKTNILLVAMGAPVQEKFIKKYKSRINTNIIFAVGGLFDFYSNRIKRAPLFLREIGFEWVYRILQEPKRMWRRYVVGNPLFLFRVYKYKNQLAKKDVMHSYLKNYEQSSRRYKIKKSLWAFSIVLRDTTKRVLDFVAAIILMILFTPLFLAVAMIIKFTSKGNIFFIQQRVGLHGKIFNMYKFRSMVVDAEELKSKLMQQNQSKDGVIFKMKDDPRITKIGKFIRKTSIDELPQLLNVLKGQMSLVGPRPPVIEEVKLYNMDDKKRLDVKPGITCIWQVSGRSTIPFKEQVRMDKEYIKNQSIYMDVVLLLKTIPAVLFQKGSC